MLFWLSLAIFERQNQVSQVGQDVLFHALEDTTKQRSLEVYFQAYDDLNPKPIDFGFQTPSTRPK